MYVCGYLYVGLCVCCVVPAAYIHTYIQMRWYPSVRCNGEGCCSRGGVMEGGGEVLVWFAWLVVHLFARSACPACLPICPACLPILSCLFAPPPPPYTPLTSPIPPSLRTIQPKFHTPPKPNLTDKRSHPPPPIPGLRLATKYPIGNYQQQRMGGSGSGPGGCTGKGWMGWMERHVGVVQQ